MIDATVRSTPIYDLKAPNMNPLTAFLVFVSLAAAAATGLWVNLYIAGALFIVAVLIAMSLKMANVWQKFVILRMGKLQSVKGVGLFLIIPILDRVIAIIDGRIQTTAFNAEQALTAKPSIAWRRPCFAR
jgi:regulator of protease activity HflC (stomatin/prohibitin superfamily)